MGLYEFKPDDAYRFANEQHTPAKVRGNELFLKECPYCHGRGPDNEYKFSINLQTGQFNCKRSSCQASGNMITLSKEFDFSLGTEADEYYRPQKYHRKFKQPEKPYIPKPPAIEYLQNRGIPEEIAQKYEVTVQTEHPNVLVFPFYDENGVLQFIKYRKTDFDKTKDKNKEWSEEGGKPILFGMKQCADFGRLVITEGQLDSLSVATAGIDNAVSVPIGVKGWTWVPYCWDWMTKFDEIVVFGDHEDGHITLLDDIRRRFPNKVKHVREADYLECKDANELLQKHGPDAVRRAVEQAVNLPVRQVLDLEDVENVNVYDLEKMKTGINELDKLLYGGLPFGSVILIGGKRGDGKSTLASQFMVSAVDQGFVTLAYSGELPNYLYKAWFDYQVAGPDNIIETTTSFGTPNRFITEGNQKLIEEWYGGKAFIYDNRISGDDEKASLIDTITHAIMQYGVRVILIDNLMTAMFDEPLEGNSKYELQSSFVQKLTRLALEHNVLILLVAHMRKNSVGDTNDDISGSGDITNLAGITLSYNRDKDLNDDQRRLVVAKNRLFGKTDFDGIVLDYNEKSKRIYGLGDDLRRHLGWERSEFMEANYDDEDIPFD